VVPYIQKAPVKLDRILICWDGSRPAARAIADALPLLVRAKAIEILVVASERDKSGELTGTNMHRHLGRHGIAAEIKRIAAGGVDVAATILSHAADSGAQFMVLGGYGHSRLREFILGGVTRNILAAMTVPVLMSH
jgi:nucleotide-binding universal stress UspA family protein